MWSLWTEIVGEVNWLAVLVGTLGAFALGSVWYSKSVFGRKWMKLVGVKEGGKPTTEVMAKTMSAGSITTLISAWGVAVLQNLLGVDGWVDGLTFGLFLGVVFVATNVLMNYVYEQRSMILWKINASYSTIGLAIISVIIAVWPK